MKTYRTFLLPLIALCVVVALTVWFMKRGEFSPWSKIGREVHSGLGSEVLVMHTKGGLLEVATIKATEPFDQAFIYTVFGANVGRTVAHIRVPAVYRYHIELAPEWDVYRKGNVFTVVTPPVKPSLPVAVDLARMEKDEGGSWYLMPFNEQEDLDTLQRRITAELAKKSVSQDNMRRAKNEARKTVREFVQKWLINQKAWKEAQNPEILVKFEG